MLILDTPESGPCTREEAFNPNLIPSATDTYQPLSNEELVNMIVTVADQQNLELSDFQLGMDLKGMRFFGTCLVLGKSFLDEQIRLMIGFCNSYNRSMSARVCVGGEVTVCSNRAFYAYTDDTTGVVGMAIHSHRRFIKTGLFQRITEAFSSLDEYRQCQERFYRRLQDCRLNQDEAYALIIRAAQAGVVNKTRVLSVAEQWDLQERKPETDEEAKKWHEEFVPRNAYSLFNAFTEVEKSRLARNPVQSNIQTMSLTEFFWKKFMN